MEAAVGSDGSLIEDLEPNEDTFCGFSPDRQDEVIQLDSFVQKLEGKIEKLMIMSSLEMKKEEKDASAAEVETKTPDAQVANGHAKGVQKIAPAEGSKQSEGEASAETSSSQESANAEPAVKLLLPFFKGWKREVNLKEKEVCYIHPFGARLKNMSDLSMQLTEGLSADNFTFEAKVLGASPEYERIVQSVRKSGRVPVPSSNYKIAERLEEESRKRVNENNGHTPPTKRGKLVLKLKSGRAENKDNSEKGSKKRSTLSRKSSSHFRRNEKTNWTAEKVEEEPRRNCTLECPMAMGLIPSLQCCVCLCLYHPECAEVGLTGSGQQIHGYVCKSCRAKPENRKPSEPVASSPVAPQRPQPTPNLPQPPPSAGQSLAAPQQIITLNRRRFVMVPNYLPTPSPSTSSQANDSTAAVAGAAAANPIPGPSMKPEKPVEKKEKVDSKHDLISFTCQSYTTLLNAFKNLYLNDVLRIAPVCVLFRDLSQHPEIWKRVKLNGNVGDWEIFVELMNKRGTKSLDIRELFLPPEDRLEPLLHIKCLERIYFPQISLNFLCSLLNSESNIRVCCAEISETGRDACLKISAPRLEKFQIRHQNPTPLELTSLDLSSCASHLTSLSLISFTNWQSVDLMCLKQLTKLKELQFGDCTLVPPSFCEVLAALTELMSVRLEVGGESPLVEILEVLSTLPNLEKLELLRFDCPPGFEEAFSKLTTLKRLLIVPLFEFQMAAKLNSLLSSLYRLSNNLEELCWVFLVELLQVSDLFIKTIKSGGLDSCVPIMLPLPVPENTTENEGFWSDLTSLNSRHSYVPMTLTQIHAMFANALRKAKTKLLVLPKMATVHMNLDDVVF